MANEIRYGVKFDTDTSGLARMKSALQQISTLNKSLSNSDVAKAMGVSAKEATSSFIKIKDQIENVEKALKTAFNTKLDTVNIETFNRVLKESGSSMEQVYAAFKNAGPAGVAAFNSLSSSVLNTNIQLKQSHTLLDKMATTLGNTIKWNAASSVVNGLSRSVEQAWGYVKNLDSSLNDIRVVTGKSADEMANFAKQANAAAQSLGRTTTDYTKAALIYAQQGLSDEQIARRSEITLKTANVTGQSTQAVSEELTAVWNGYKVSAEEAELYVDRLAAVAATTASDLEELSTGMSKVASAAAAMGVGQDQLAAQLSTIISVTRQAPESVGTALRTVYARISDIKAGIDEDGVTLGNYSGKMAELGFNVLDAAGNLRDMGQVMEEIGGRWQDLTREQQINLAQTMAGQRQYSNLIALFDNFESYNKALATAQNAEGTLAQQQDIAMERTAAHLNILKASVENIYDSLIDTKPINNLIDGLSDVANKVATVIDGFGGGIPILESLGAVGLSVFSSQIAKGINTTIINLETAKNNALQFSQALEATRQSLEIKGLGQTSEQLLKAREQMLALSKVMTPQQFNGIQNLLNDLKNAENEFTIMKGQVEGFSQDLKKLGINQNFEAVSGNSQLTDQVNERIKAYVELANKIKQYYQLASNPPETFSNDSDKIKNIITDLEKLQQQGKLTEEEFKEIKEAYSKALEENASEQDRINFWQRLKAAVQQLKKEMDPNAFESLSTALGEGFVQKVQEAEQRVKRFSDNFSEAMNRMFNAQKIQNVTDFVGALGRIGTGLQQIKNLGSIWNKEDVSTGDKILQTLTSLGFALPTVISGFTKLTSVLKITGTALTTVNAVAAVIGVAISAIGIYRQALQEKHDAEIKDLESSIEAQKQKQAEIEKNEELYSSLEQLNQKYQEGQISRYDLKSSVEDIITQYGLQGDAVNTLKDNYDNLSESLRQLKIENAQQAYDSATRQINASEKLIREKAEQNAEFVKTTIQKNGGGLPSSYQLQLNSGKSSGEDEDIVRDVLARLGFQESNHIIGSNIASINIDYDSDSLIKLYEDIQDVVDEMYELHNSTEEIEKLDNSEYFQGMLNWLGLMKDAYNELKDAQDAQQEAQATLIALGQLPQKNQGSQEASGEKGASTSPSSKAQQEEKVRPYDQFKNAKTIQDYIQARDSYIKAIQEATDQSVQQATRNADNYIKANFKQLYNGFDEAARYVDDIRNKFTNVSEEELNEIINKLGGLDQQQFEALLALSPSTVSNWEEVKNAIQLIAGSDFSNVKDLEEVSASNLADEASNQYNLYKKVQDNVAKGQSISSEDYEKLDPELQGFFNRLADGTYKLKDDAEAFYEAVDNFKIDGFNKALEAAQTELSQLQQLAEKNFNYSDLTKSSVIGQKTTQQGTHKVDVDYELAQQQLDYLRTVTDESNTGLMTSINLWQDMIDKQKIDTAAAEEMANAVSQAGDQTLNLNDHIAETQSLINSIIFQIKDAQNDVNISELTQKAQNEYNKYQGLIDATKDGGTISSQDWLSLDKEIQQFFEITENGTFKLKSDAQGFQEAIDNVSLSVLEDAVKDIQTLQNTDYNNISQNSAFLGYSGNRNQYGQKIYDIDKNLLNQQLDYLDAVTEENTQLDKQIDKWRQLGETGKLTNTQAQQILKLIIDTTDQTRELTEEQQQRLDLLLQQIEAAKQRNNVIENPQTLAEKYNNYENLKDKVSKGGTLSADEYKALEPELQSYFGQMLDGTYKLVKAAEDFNNAVDNLQIDSAKDAINQLNTKTLGLSNLNNIGFNTLSQDASQLSQAAPPAYTDTSTMGLMYNMPAPGNISSSLAGNSELVQQQVEYLKLFGEYSTEQLQLWENINPQAQNYAEICKQISEEVQKTGDHTEELRDKLSDSAKESLGLQYALGNTAESMQQLQKMFDKGALSPEVFNSLAVGMQHMEDMKGLDADQVKEYAEYLEKTVDGLKEFDGAAENAAVEVLRMNKGIQTLAKNFDKWEDILSNSSDTSYQYFEALDQLKQTMSDLTGVSQNFISDDTILNNMEDLRLAAEGDADAIDRLKMACADDVIARIILDNGLDAGQIQVIETLWGHLKANLPDIDAGVTLSGDDQFIAALNEMIRQAGMTVPQINSLLSGLGFSGTFASQPQEMKVQQAPLATKHHQISNFHLFDVGGGGFAPSWDEVETITYDPQPAQTVTAPNFAYQAGQPGTVAVPKLETLTKLGGPMNDFSGGNSGGSSPSGRSGGGGGGRKGGGGGKKGGGGKGKKGSGSDKQKQLKEKQKKEKREDQVDIYHDVNKQLSNIERALGRLQKKQDKLWGKQLLDNLNKQSALLEQHKQKLQEKLALQQKDLANKRKDLELLGATFDEYGNISNYVELVSKKQQILNKLIDKYNKLVEKYNKATSEKKKKDLEKRIQKFEKEIKDAEKQLDDLEDKVKDYDALQEDMADVQDQIEDDIQQQIQINIKKFRMSIEIRLEMGEAERDWNKFVREVMHHTDVIKDSPFDKIFQDAKQQLDDVMSYFDVHGAGSTLTALVNQMYATKDQIEQINATGWSSIYGDNNGTAMQDLQSDLDTLMSQMQDIESLLDNIDQAYLDTIDDVQDNFDKQIDDYEYVTDLIEHDIDLLELLYGEKNYNAMNEYYTTLERNQTNQLDALRKQAEFWKKQWQEAAAAGDKEAAKKFEENYRQALDNLNSVIEQAAETIQNKYINAIDNIFDVLDKKISGGLGTDYLNMQWQLINKNAETYLDTVNAAFAIQELQTKYNKAINETQSIKNQQTLKKLMDEQLENLRNKEKISQYDVDRAEKLLQIEQARIALEDAQSSKTSLRLKRDSQGNYSYQYVSDADKALQAQQKLNEAQNDLYNFDKQAYKANLDEMLAMWQEFQEKYRQIVLDTSLTEEQRVRDLALLREEYGEYINTLTEKNLTIRQNLLNSAFDSLNSLYQWDITNYQQMSDEKKAILMEEVANYQQMSDEEKRIFMEELVPMWTSGIQKMADKVAAQGGFIPMCKQAFEDIHKATQDYKKQLDDMAHTAGIDLTDVRSGVDELSMSFQNLIMDNDELINHMFQEISAIQELRMEAQMLVAQYQNVYQSALQAASAIHEFIQAQRAQAAAQAEMMAAMQQQAAAAAAPAPASASAPAAQSSGNSGDYLIQQTKVKSLDGSGTLTIEEKVYPVGGSGGGKKKNKAAKFDSGGYTGDWDTSNGKFAILHEKELVLNQSDTQNLLNSVQILRDLATNAQLGMSSRLSDVEVFRSAVFNGDKDTIEQNVQITATFPNVNSKQQIEDAFNDLINLAAQRAMRNR